MGSVSGKGDLYVAEIIIDSHGPNGRHLNRLQALSNRDAFQKKFDSLSGMTFGNSKRNFDEIDNAGFGAFVKKNWDSLDMYPKRNFDEIDNAGFGAFLKRST